MKISPITHTNIEKGMADAARARSRGSATAADAATMEPRLGEASRTTAR